MYYYYYIVVVVVVVVPVVRIRTSCGKLPKQELTQWPTSRLRSGQGQYSMIASYICVCICMCIHTYIHTYIHVQTDE